MINKKMVDYDQCKIRTNTGEVLLKEKINIKSLHIKREKIIGTNKTQKIN